MSRCYEAIESLLRKNLTKHFNFKVIDNIVTLLQVLDFMFIIRHVETVKLFKLLCGC